MNKQLKKFYISGMAWIPSYRDFDQYDTTVEATSKENALEVFNEQLSVFNTVLDLDISVAPIKRNNDDSELKPLMLTVDSLGLSARSFNSLDRAGMKFIGELVLMSENEIKNIKNLGKKSLDEINECLVEHGFGSEFDLPDVTRVNLVKKIEQLKA